MGDADISPEHGWLGLPPAALGSSKGGGLVLVGSTSQHVFLGSAPFCGVASEHNKCFDCLHWAGVGPGCVGNPWGVAQAYRACRDGQGRGDAA